MPFARKGRLTGHIFGCKHSLFTARREGLLVSISCQSRCFPVAQTSASCVTLGRTSLRGRESIASKMYPTCAPHSRRWVAAAGQTRAALLCFRVYWSGVSVCCRLHLNIHEPESGRPPLKGYSLFPSGWLACLNTPTLHLEEDGGEVFW